MTYLEELRIEADKMGYNLTPKPAHKLKLEPCFCGAKQHVVVGNWKSFTVRCPKCGNKIEYITPNGIHSTKAETENKARSLWNETVLYLSE